MLPAVAGLRIDANEQWCRRHPMKKFLTLEFIPRSADLALLVLRVWLGASMLSLHGWGKLLGLINGTSKFPDIFGIGAMPVLIVAIFAEFLCSAFLILGLWSRLAAFFLATTMGTAFFAAHGAKLSGPGNGELAFVYLAGFVAILMAGAGRYSVDQK